jgi:hypothetical protein
MTYPYTTMTNPRITCAPEQYQVLFQGDLIVTSGSTDTFETNYHAISNRILPGNKNITYLLPELSNQTKWFSFGAKKNNFDQVRSKINSITNQDVKSTSEIIVELLDKYISPYGNIDLPKLYSCIRDDGSYLIEWDFEHYKLGISIELKFSESSWYFVSDEFFGYFSVSGETKNKNFPSILEWLIPFMISKRVD